MRRCGLTLMELLVVMSLLATLSAFLYPVFLRVRAKIYVTSCGDQLRQIGLALKMYIHDFSADNPYGIPYWDRLYPHYISDKRLLVCPYFRALAPDVVEELDEFLQKRRKRPYYSYRAYIPVGEDDIAKREPLAVSFAERYAFFGDQVVIGVCDTHRIGCPKYGSTLVGNSPKGRKFCAEYCTNPYTYFPDKYKGFFPLPPGKLSDLSQPFILLRLSGSVVFDYGGTWEEPSIHLMLPHYK